MKNSKKTADYWEEIAREYYSLDYEEEFSDFEDDYAEEEEVF